MMRALLLAMLLTACGTPRDVTIRTVPDLLQPTAAAIAVWSDALASCHRSLSITTGDPDVDVRYGQTTDGSLAQYQTHPHGPFSDGTIRVQPDAAWSEADLVHLLAHEFGHALGAADSSNPADLMWGESNAEWPVLTDADVRQVCEGW